MIKKDALFSMIMEQQLSHAKVVRVVGIIDKVTTISFGISTDLKVFSAEVAVVLDIILIMGENTRVKVKKKK